MPRLPMRVEQRRPRLRGLPGAAERARAQDKQQQGYPKLEADLPAAADALADHHDPGIVGRPHARDRPEA